MATSNITFGAVLNAAMAGKKLPENTALDKEGNFTTDPEKALEGSALPFDNSYKGSGLGMVVETLAGLLTGGGGYTSLYKDKGWGNFFMVFSPELFMPRDQFKARMDEFLKRMENARTKDGQKLRLPGMSTLANRDRHIKEGKIEIADVSLAELEKRL